MTSRTIFALLTLAVATGPAAAQSDPELPYWASISVDEARMRKGPSPDVPVIWEYRRKDLPVKVIARHELWRKIEDPDGTQGWMATSCPASAAMHSPWKRGSAVCRSC